MKKINVSIWKIALVILILASVIAVCGIGWHDSAQTLKITINENTITGRAYVDHGTIGALDNFDWPATGLKLQLFQLVGKESIPVQETVVGDDGQYRFVVEQPGTYFISPIYAVPGYPAWNSIIRLQSYNIFVEEGGLDYPGTIFLCQNEGLS